MGLFSIDIDNREGYFGGRVEGLVRVVGSAKRVRWVKRVDISWMLINDCRQ